MGRDFVKKLMPDSDSSITVRIIFNNHSRPKNHITERIFFQRHHDDVEKYQTPTWGGHSEKGEGWRKGGRQIRFVWEF